MASDFRKPDMVHTLFPEEIKKKMWQLPVSDLYFVGRATEKKLLTMGIHTIGDLARADVDMLKIQLKKQGETIWNFANGIDFTVVQSEPSKNKGYGNSTTLSFDVEDSGTAKHILLSLVETVSGRLRQDKVKISSVSVSIKDNNFKTSSHQKSLTTPTDITNEIHQAACELFDEMWDGTPIRQLGIQTTKIEDDFVGRQMSLFDNTDYEKLEKLDKAVDEIRDKYGKDKIKRATFLR
jgi:DNA polymerase-4